MDQKILRLFSSKWMRCTQHLNVHFLVFLHLFNSRWMRAHSTCVFVFWYLQILTFSRLSSSPRRLFAWARECTLKYHFDWLINIFQRYLKKKSPRSTLQPQKYMGCEVKLDLTSPLSRMLAHGRVKDKLMFMSQTGDTDSDNLGSDCGLSATQWLCMPFQWLKLTTLSIFYLTWQEDPCFPLWINPKPDNIPTFPTTRLPSSIYLGRNKIKFKGHKRKFRKCFFNSYNLSLPFK